MNADAIEKELTAIVDAFAQKLPLEHVQYLRELLEAGERGIALEDLCTHIYEYDVAVAPDVLAKIRQIGNVMGINPKSWEILKAE